MANLVPFGTDPNGRFKRAEDGDQIVDEAGNPLGGGKPTPATYGVEPTPTMTGDRTLTNTDAVLQYLDPNGADRTVTLPALTTATPLFLVRHIGTANIITIRDSGGGLVARLTAGEAVQVQHDGSTNIGAVVQDLTAGLTFGVSLIFNGDITAGNFFFADEDPTQGTGATGYRQFHGLPVSAYFTHVSWYVQSNSNSILSIYRNNVLVTTATTTALTSDYGIVALDAPFEADAGDIISIQQGTDTQDTTITLYGRAALDADKGYDFVGGNVNWSANQFAFMSGCAQTSNTQTTPAGRSEVTIPVAGTSIKFCFTQNGNTASTFKFWKNGLDAGSFSGSWTLKDGSATYTNHGSLPITLAPGDTLAVERDVGASLVSTNMLIRVVGVPAEVFHFAGNMNTTFRFPRPLQVPTGTPDSANTVGTNMVYAVTKLGGIPAISYRHSTAPNADFSLYKNGVFSESFNAQSVNGAVLPVTNLSTYFSEGDLVGIAGNTTGTSAGESNYLIAFY